MSYYGHAQGYAGGTGGGHSGGNGNFYGQQPMYSSTQQPAYNAQSWQAPQPQQQQSQQAQQPNYGNPSQPQYPGQQFASQQQQPQPQPLGALSQALGNEAVQQMVKDQAKAFALEGIAKIVPGLESSMITLRTYFAVDNQYVLKKMQKVLMPFLSKDWNRQVKQHAGPESPTVFDLPLNDVNAPDLYLPTMTLVSYVLLCAICYGTAGQFDPDVIPDVTTKCVLTQVLEVVAMKVGFYSLQTPVAFLDLFSYTGYKYLGLCLNLLLGMLGSQLELGTRVYYLCFCYTAAAAAYFLWRTVEHNLMTTGPQRNVVAIAVAASQLVTMWFLGQTKFLQ